MYKMREAQPLSYLCRKKEQEAEQGVLGQSLLCQGSVESREVTTPDEIQTFGRHNEADWDRDRSECLA